MDKNKLKNIQKKNLNTGFYDLEPKAFQNKLNSTKPSVIIDVRTPEEFTKGAIPNAINISYLSDDFWERVSVYNTGNNVFVYSQTGRKSIRACMLMRNGGFNKDQIYNLDSGYRAWKKGRV